MTTREILTLAKSASHKRLDASTKNTALMAMAEALILNADSILAANAIDVEKAKGVISDVMIDRLKLNEQRISDMAVGIREVAELTDPVGKVTQRVERQNGLLIERVREPFGVVAIIYESRPNVTADAAALTLKSGNACVLRIGKEAYNSGLAIVNAIRSALVSVGVDENYINLISDTTRASANELMTAVGYVDLLIPRGGAGLIRACIENAKVPCIQTGTGICHIYVDSSADIDMAVKIIVNAKTSRPSVCNAEEVLLVNSDIADKLLPELKAAMPNVELRLCPRAMAIIDGTPADDNDFDTEFLDYILAVKVIDTLDEAISHINAHSTGHSDAIITKSSDNADKFVNSIDSAAVYVNASTRFTDGGVFGLGCEMGISTQKLHARGPMGLEELTTYKYVIHGNGQVR